jgi:hypothetical protein
LYIIRLTRAILAFLMTDDTIYTLEHLMHHSNRHRATLTAINQSKTRHDSFVDIDEDCQALPFVPGACRTWGSRAIKRSEFDDFAGP